MSDDTMAQDGFEPRPEIDTPAPDTDPARHPRGPRAIARSGRRDKRLIKNGPPAAR